jgi:hypothetical protein
MEEKTVLPGMKRPQLGSLFQLVGLHTGEHIIQNGDGLGDKGSFIEHDAFGPFSFHRLA